MTFNNIARFQKFGFLTKCRTDVYSVEVCEQQKNVRGSYSGVHHKKFLIHFAKDAPSGHPIWTKIGCILLGQTQLLKLEFLSATNISKRWELSFNHCYLQSLPIFSNNENCRERPHIASISNAAGIQNCVYVGKEFLLLATIFVNVNLLLSYLQAAPDRINLSGLLLTFL